MNNRDPFNLRRNSPAFTLLQANAASLGQRAVQASQRVAAVGVDVAEKGKSIVDQSAQSNMSFASSQGGPTHRHTDMWQSLRANEQANESVSEKISGMFASDKKDSLPMYKDKPYAYPGSRKHMPFYRRKRIVALLLASLAAVSWWFGILSPLSYFSSSGTKSTSKSKSSWGLMGSSSNVDWDERAEKVKDAFRTSFNDYEKHAWGMCRVWLPPSMLPWRKTDRHPQGTMSITR